MHEKELFDYLIANDKMDDFLGLKGDAEETDIVEHGEVENFESFISSDSEECSEKDVKEIREEV